MSRTTKDTAQYFPHEADASGGDTLTALEGQFGNDGYTFWFKLLEKLCRSPGHYLDTNDTKPWIVHLGRCRIDENKGVEMVNLLVEMGALDKELWLAHRIIWSQNLVNNLADVYRNRRRPVPEKPMASPYKLLEKGTENESDIIQENLASAKLITTGEDDITTSGNPLTTQQSKVKETKQKEIKEDNSVKDELTITKEDVLDVYRGSIGEPSEDMENEIDLACQRFTPEWVRDAIQEAVKRGRKDWPYIVGILKNWKRYGKDVAPDKFRRGKYQRLAQR